MLVDSNATMFTVCGVYMQEMGQTACMRGT